MAKVTEYRLEKVIEKTQFHRCAGTTVTVCLLTLQNGFTVVGKSACADPEEYNQAEGEKYALADAKRQIWPLEGYLLAQKLHEA